MIRLASILFAVGLAALALAGVLALSGCAELGYAARCAVLPRNCN